MIRESSLWVEVGTKNNVVSTDSFRNWLGLLGEFPD